MTKRKSKKGKSVKNNPDANAPEPEELTKAPHSFVIHRGKVGRYLLSLMMDFRKVMEPFTASSLKVRKKNVLKDFVAISGLLHVSHLVMFTKTDHGCYVRFARFPRGPTLTFRIDKYSLARDVLSQQKKQFISAKQFKNSPLVVLNNFSGEGAHMKLMASMLQNMFPTINLTKVQLDLVRRCVLFNYNKETNRIDFRHYCIRVAPVGLSRAVKKLVQSKVPNLSRYNDIADYITRGDVSESEFEDDPDSHVTLPQQISSRGNMVASQSAIRLYELGPRLSLQLIKIEAGLLDGEVLYHEFITKTEEEITLITKRRAEKRRLKEQRRREQERNKALKEQKKAELKKKSLEGIEKKRKQLQITEELETDKLMARAVEEANTGIDDEDENDADWYKKEVGEEPDEDLFAGKKKQGLKRKMSPFSELRKKKKSNSEGESQNVKKKSFNSDRFKKPFKNKSNTSLKNSSQRKVPGQDKKFRQKKRVIGSKVRMGQRH